MKTIIVTFAAITIIFASLGAAHADPAYSADLASRTPSHEKALNIPTSLPAKNVAAGPSRKIDPNLLPDNDTRYESGRDF